MTRKRLSREDSREQTTQRLLDAAEKLIARKGLDAAVSALRGRFVQEGMMANAAAR